MRQLENNPFGPGIPAKSIIGPKEYFSTFASAPHLILT